MLSGPAALPGLRSLRSFWTPALVMLMFGIDGVLLAGGVTLKLVSWVKID